APCFRGFYSINGLSIHTDLDELTRFSHDAVREPPQVAVGVERVKELVAPGVDAKPAIGRQEVDDGLHRTLAVVGSHGVPVQVRALDDEPSTSGRELAVGTQLGQHACPRGRRPENDEQVAARLPYLRENRRIQRVRANQSDVAVAIEVGTSLWP